MKVRPYGLIQAELLKLRKRRGLTITVALMTIGIIVVVFGVLVILHIVNPAHHPAPGGLEDFGGGAGTLGQLGSIAAIIVGCTVGASDERAGIFRELVVTGRDRIVLFLVRVPGSLGYLLVFIAVAYLVVAGMGLAGGHGPSVSFGLVLGTALWLVLEIGFYLVLAIGVAALIGSRGTAIGVLLAWRLIVVHILGSITFLGGIRNLLPTGALTRLTPTRVHHDLGELDLSMSLAAAIAVLVVWTGLALAAGAWRTATRDA